LFASHGWVFFAPYRRGQGLSARAGTFIGDEITAARVEQAWHGVLLAVPSILLLLFFLARRRRTWIRAAWSVGLCLVAAFAIHLSARQAAASTKVRLLERDHLSDQLAALRWLRAQSFVEGSRIATAGNSFGGIQVVLGAERVEYCAAVDGSGGAESWAASPELRARMTRAARRARAPIFFFQAENDYDLSPSRTLSGAMKSANKPYQLKIYPAFGVSSREGHRFAWAGWRIWAGDVFRLLDAHCAE